MLPLPAVPPVRRPLPLQINIDPPLILLGPEIQPKLPTNLLNPRLQLLHMINRVVPPPNNNPQMRRSPRPLGTDPLLEDPLRLLDELPVEVDAVGVHAARRVVLAEDEVRGLPVVVVHLRGVGLSLVGEGLCASAVAGGVGGSGLGAATLVWLSLCPGGAGLGWRAVTYAREAVIALVGLFPRKVPEAVIFALDIAARAVVEGFDVGIALVSQFYHTQSQARRSQPALHTPPVPSPNLHIMSLVRRGGCAGSVEAGVVTYRARPAS